MPKSADERITLMVLEPVQAELAIVTDSGKRPPTHEELNSLGLRRREDMYRRTKELLSQIGDYEEDDRILYLRHFIEYITHYDHDVPPSTINGMKALLAGEPLPVEDEPEPPKGKE